MAVKEFIPPDPPPKKYVSPGLKSVRLRFSDVEKATDKLLKRLYNLGFDEQIKFELEQTSATFSDQPISIDDLKYTLHQSAPKHKRVEASTRWRRRAGIKQVQINLKPEVVRLLDRLVEDSGASGRAEIITRLVNEASRQSENTTTRCLAEGCGRKAETTRSRDQGLPLR